MARKYKFAFIVAKRGEKVGIVKAYSKLDKARKMATDFRKRGYRVSQIAKTSKL